MNNDNLLPFLDVCGPDGQQFRVEMLKDHITIGRFEQFNDVALHTEAEINHLIWELRRKIEIDAKDPQFLETVRGLGYRLVTHPLSA